jgi:hypothetical protein
LILLLLLGYFFWKIVQVVFKMFGVGQGVNRGPDRQTSEQRPTPDQFRDVKDAEFEDLPPAEKKSGDVPPPSS